MAYASIEPFGEERMDQRFRIMTAWIVSAVRIDGEPMHPDQIQFTGQVTDEDLNEMPLDDLPSAHATPADVSQDLREQAMFA